MARFGGKLVPRLLALCLFMQTSLCLAAVAISQNDQSRKKVTVIANNMAIQQVFRIIEKQTGLKFFYNNDILNRDEKITINMVERPLDEVLVRMLQHKDLTWLYIENVVRIGRRNEPSNGSRPRDIKPQRDTTVTSVAISGKVTAADGSPVAGATVLVKGTDVGATTDAEGDFTVMGRRENNVLLIRSIGYETREVPVTGKSILVRLNVAVSDLDETVVIAYGTTTRRLSTGNISSVKAKDIEKQPVNNPLLALQGRVPGLFITQNTGVPGGGITVRLQGRNSLNRGSDPLYIIDGVPYASQMMPNISTDAGILGPNGNTNTFSPGGGGNPLSFVNPADIESIEVLKDADATAIYGSRAANGAILITTKKGKAGKTKIGLNIQHGWGRLTKKLPLLNTSQYLEMRREAFFINDGLTVNSPEYITAYDINGTWDTTHYTDWQKEIIGGTAHYTDVQVSASGGAGNTSFLVGAGYHRETTVFPGDLSDQKVSVHLNLNHSSSNQRFQLEADGKYLVDDNKLIFNDLSQAAIAMPPNAPSLYNQDGTLNWAQLPDGTSTWYNPLAYIRNKYNIKTYNLLGNASISYRPFTGLEMKSSFGYNNLQVNEVNLYPLSGVAPDRQSITPRYAIFNNNSARLWSVEPQVLYKLKLARGTFESLLGATILQSSNNGQQIYGLGQSSDFVMEDIRAAPTIGARSSISSTYKYSAVFGRINYNWENKYIINLSARRDGSSRFGERNLFHNFGSVGVAWLFSNENFIQENFPLISYGKLRGSYGITGNDQIGDYQFMNLYSPYSVAVAYQGVTGIEPTGLSNPYLQWETTKKLQVGIDIGIIKDRVLLNVTHLYNRSSNLLEGYTLPYTTGFNNIQVNFPATIQNTGWEISLNTRNIERTGFSWNTNFNITIPKNKLVSFPGLETSSYRDYYVIGQPVTVQKVLNLVGVDPTTGLYEYAAKSGGETSSPIFPDDATSLRNIDPTLYGGLENTITYKGFELSFLFQFAKKKAGSYVYGNLPGFFYSDNMGTILGNQPTYILDRWRKPGDVAPIQRFSATYLSDVYTPYSYVFLSTGLYADASFIRLKNLSLSYQLKEQWLKRMRLESVRLYIQGQNLLTFTKYKGMDPESTNEFRIPPLKLLTIGLQVGL
jgi:TonB-linked SusC/RagA family outer membrane protein